MSKIVLNNITNPENVSLINENFNKVRPEIGVDYIKHGGIIFANKTHSVDRIANPHFTLDFSIEFEDIYAIIINFCFCNIFLNDPSISYFAVIKLSPISMNDKNLMLYCTILVSNR